MSDPEDHRYARRVDAQGPGDDIRGRSGLVQPQRHRIGERQLGDRCTPLHERDGTGLVATGHA